MKKYASIFVLMAVMPVVSANAYDYVDTTTETYTQDVRPVKTSVRKTTTTNRKTGGYKNTITNNFYYSQPQSAKVSSYDVDYGRGVKKSNVSYGNRYSNNNSYTTTTYDYGTKKQVSRVKEVYSYAERKYFLAHPFFQPLKGKVGSITDVSYGAADFKFDMLNASVLDIDTNSPTYSQAVEGALALSGKADIGQFLVKEDISVGLSDTLTLIGMLQYDRTKVSFKDWSSGDPDASTSDSGLNVFGIGIQDRFIDNEKWIGMVAGSFQHQKDVANMFLGEVKMGYKVDRTTIYGLARLRYVAINHGDAYGAFVNDDTGDYIMLSYKNNTKDLFNIEGGVGAFAVLGKDFTLNGELVYGHYDWHDQLSVRGAFGWQPGDMFALNLYASTSLYDNADSKKKMYMNYDVNPDVSALPSEFSGTTLVYTTGDYKIKDYKEWRLGAQIILYF